MSPEINNR